MTLQGPLLNARTSRRMYVALGYSRKPTGPSDPAGLSTGGDTHRGNRRVRALRTLRGFSLGTVSRRSGAVKLGLGSLLSGAHP